MVQLNSSTDLNFSNIFQPRCWKRRLEVVHEIAEIVALVAKGNIYPHQTPVAENLCL
ncbi:unnamed protein product [Cuscuta epithymum]|uniref:Uncharacterized protein n=1 Tax=Cuscuta epithymum TaxID=186058 RepID=A0AAV0CC84_9ASTE|nr:unnamed protein product [Cuscuta epithymum]